MTKRNEPPSGKKPKTAKRKSLWEQLDEISASIPKEEWDKLPRDLSTQIDHYLYGTPKRD